MRPSEGTRRCDPVRDKFSIPALDVYWIEKTLLEFSSPLWLPKINLESLCNPTLSHHIRLNLLTLK